MASGKDAIEISQFHISLYILTYNHPLELQLVLSFPFFFSEILKDYVLTIQNIYILRERGRVLGGGDESGNNERRIHCNTYKVICVCANANSQAPSQHLIHLKFFCFLFSFNLIILHLVNQLSGKLTKSFKKLVQMGTQICVPSFLS